MAGRTYIADDEALAYHGGALDVARRLRPTRRRPGSISRPESIRTPIRCPTSRRTSGRACPTAIRSRTSRLSRPGAMARDRRRGRRPRLAGADPDFGAQRPAGLRNRARGDLPRPCRGLRRGGRPVSRRDCLDALTEAGVAIVVNPNNPDGRSPAGAGLLDLGARLARRGAWLIVDEAFADFDGENESLAPVLPETGTVVLRSFGKAFGLAGSGSGSPSLRRTSRRSCGRRSARGRSAGRRSRSAPARSPISNGLRRCGNVCPRTRRGSTRSSRRAAGAFSAGPGCFASRPRPAAKPRFSVCSPLEF